MLKKVERRCMWIWRGKIHRDKVLHRREDQYDAKL